MKTSRDSQGKFSPDSIGCAEVQPTAARRWCRRWRRRRSQQQHVPQHRQRVQQQIHQDPHACLTHRNNTQTINTHLALHKTISDPTELDQNAILSILASFPSQHTASILQLCPLSYNFTCKQWDAVWGELPGVADTRRMWESLRRLWLTFLLWSPHNCSTFTQMCSCSLEEVQRAGEVIKHLNTSSHVWHTLTHSSRMKKLHTLSLRPLHCQTHHPLTDGDMVWDHLIRFIQWRNTRSVPRKIKLNMHNSFYSTCMMWWIHCPYSRAHRACVNLCLCLYRTWLIRVGSLWLWMTQ